MSGGNAVGVWTGGGRTLYKGGMGGLSFQRGAVAMGLGLAGSVAIWVATTYSNFYFGLTFISDSYLPVAGLFLMLLAGAVLNPLLRRFAPRAALSREQLALIFGMWLLASVIPGQGLMRQLPYMLARAPMTVSASKPLADIYTEMDLPASLFPAPMAFQAETPAATWFIEELPPGERIPWQAWTGPLLAWGALLICLWLAMIGLALIVFPQWRRNERLQFPLLAVYEPLLESPPEGQCVPSLFRQPLFWSAFATVVVIYLLNGFHTYFPTRVPEFPLSWDIRGAFRDTPLRYFPNSILFNTRLYFVFIGVAFFMPTRISFSIWMFAVLYGIHRVIRVEYFPPHIWHTVSDHRTGAMLTLSLFVLWLGRAQWRAVVRGMLRRPGSDPGLGRAGWMLALGLIGATLWLRWAGVPLGWGVVFVFVGFLVALLITRIVGETGMPFLRLEGAHAMELLVFMPRALLSHATVFFAGISAILFQVGSRVHPTAMAAHAIGLDSEETQVRRAWWPASMLAVLVLGLGVAGAATLVMNYRHSAPLHQAPPINSWGMNRINPVNSDLQRFEQDALRPRTQYDQRLHIAFGAAVAGGLQWACMAVPRWPLHPVGMLLVQTFYAEQAVTSILLGWLIKVLVLRYGGARAYRRAQPLFIGLIMGEVVAGIFWGLVGGILAARGLMFHPVRVAPS